MTNPVPSLQQYLQLTESQLRTILGNNETYNRWSNDKQTRIRQVHLEIAEETAKERLDGQALGVRYLEIEAICRDLKNRANEDRAKNLAVLNAEQRAKLAAVEDAIRLLPVISQAQYGNLAGSNQAPAFFVSNFSSINGTLIGGGLSASGCIQPVVQGTRWFDTSAFAGADSSLRR